jgi:acyl-CoA synthetase (AMP-forming)/AMP-acid ligase II
MNIADIILAQGDDAATAIYAKDTSLAYGQLRRDVTCLAESLLAQGHSAGDRIGIFSENSSFFIIAYFAIIMASLVAVPFQTELTEEAFEQIVLNAGVEELFVSKRFLNRLRPWANKLGLILRVEGEEGTRASGVNRISEVGSPRRKPGALSSPTSLAALMFTSGSTGSPKGVMVSHRNIECNTRDIISYMKLSSEDCAMVVLPLHYCFGLSLVHSLLLAGGSVVLNNDFRLFPETVLQEMLHRECTGLAGVPSTYQILLRKSRFRQLIFPKLRWLQQAGGRLPNPHIQEIYSAFPNVDFYTMYGQTEATARLSYLPPMRLSDKLGSIGRGLPSTRLEVLRLDGTPVTPGSDEVGEIVACGDNITQGYWNDPVETAKYFREGKLYTSDLARVDSEGFIFIVERERDMIKSGGNRISAKELEDIIAQIPEVVEVAVIGAPHELLGEAIKAFVVPVPGANLTVQSVEQHCQKRLPAFKIPREFIFLKNMPHNGSGKILKLKLKEMLRV